ncbi:hypothetical protein PQE66_gp017 [Bacillus phage PBC2]|uniref:Uncharacterized protein n=1 Tax=Bacillus phage PBC2 TaxID=1675029 RepID=A0A218KBR5_9CAUD|nr:hypothetical protein PQE66_gp017 [Bacillus phage PBC2]AKQ08332.1 hypothetical protein PBC2_017 [Bacillus phage PBC2]
MKQTITLGEYKDLKMVQNELHSAEDKIVNTGYGLDMVHKLQETFKEELEENEVNEIFELLQEHGTETIATYTISNSMGYEIIYTDDEQAIIKHDNDLYLCEVMSFSDTVEELEINEYDSEDMNEDTFYIIYENSYIPLDECMRTN